MNKKDIVILAIILIVLVGGIYLIFNKSQSTGNEENNSMEKEEQNNNPTNFEIQGMKVEILKEGSGLEAKEGNTVTVDYVGTLENGIKFDSSLDRGIPFSLTLGQNSVIKGWELGLLGMRVGEKRKLIIPPDLAYGDNAVGNLIPAKSTLIFEVDMLDIN